VGMKEICRKNKRYDEKERLVTRCNDMKIRGRKEKESKNKCKYDI
jgi:hypothetical protein